MMRRSQSKRPWDKPEYQRLVSASYRGGEVIVIFADGAEARLSPRQLVSPDGPEPDWPDLRAEEYHLVVASPAGDIEIPWDVIRAHSDPAFEEFWANLVTVSGASRSLS
jgi:hypothetical protein